MGDRKNIYQNRLHDHRLAQNNADAYMYKLINSSLESEEGNVNSFLIAKERSRQNKINSRRIPHYPRFTQPSTFVSITDPDNSRTRVLQARQNEYNRFVQEHDMLPSEGFGNRYQNRSMRPNPYEARLMRSQNPYEARLMRSQNPYEARLMRSQNPYEARLMRGPSIKDSQKQTDKKRYLAKLNGHAEKIQYESFINY
jgi:hypothetical protein